MLSFKTLGSVCALLAVGAAALAQAPAGTLPAVTSPVANLVLPANGTNSIDLSTVFGLPGVVGPVVQIASVIGNFNVELYTQAAPLTCANFLGYVNSGAYNNTIISRVVPGFVVQGGEYTISLPNSLAYVAANAPTVKNEFSISNTAGTLAMAKLGSDPNSATDVWFINLADNSANLDNQNGGFTVFARVLGTGMTVANAMAAVPTYDLSSSLNGDFTNTPLINVNTSTGIVYANWLRLPTLAPIALYSTPTVPGVLSFAATTSNTAAATASVSGRILTVTAGNAGTSTITVTATDTNGNPASTTFTVTVTSAPVFTLQPNAQTVADVPGGTTVILSSLASGTPAPSYQWKFNGVPLALGATARLVIPGATGAKNAGTYTCVATNSAGTATSNSVALTFVSTTNVGRLINLSVNTTAGKSQVLTVGFVTGGSGTSGSQNLLLRATGPALAALGAPNTLADPTLTILSGPNAIAANDNWGTPASNQSQVTAADAATFAFPLTNPASLDAALVIPLPTNPGYTVQIGGNTAASGTTLAEIYDNTPSNAYTLATPRLINISSNNLIAANGSMTAGFFVGGNTSKSVLIRATGPALTALGVPGAMPDPQLALHATVNGQDTVLAANAGWGGDPQIASESSFVNAFALNQSSKDSALLLMLPPGAYTAVASSVSGVAGVALIEVYEVP